MSKNDEVDISHLIQLCRIQFSEEEKKVLKEDLKKILRYMTLLEEVDTSGAAPCIHVNETLINVLREDVRGSPMNREEFLKNAPDHVGGMIKVPPVISFEE